MNNEFTMFYLMQTRYSTGRTEENQEEYHLDKPTEIRTSYTPYTCLECYH
jgi:hypothetical protein